MAAFSRPNSSSQIQQKLEVWFLNGKELESGDTGPASKFLADGKLCIPPVSCLFSCQCFWAPVIPITRKWNQWHSFSPVAIFKFPSFLPASHLSSSLLFYAGMPRFPEFVCSELWIWRYLEIHRVPPFATKALYFDTADQSVSQGFGKGGLWWH